MTAIARLVVRLFGKREVAANPRNWRNVISAASGAHLSLRFTCADCGLEKTVSDAEKVAHCGRVESQPDQTAALFLPVRYSQSAAGAAHVIDTHAAEQEVIEYESSSPEWI